MIRVRVSRWSVALPKGIFRVACHHQSPSAEPVGGVVPQAASGDRLRHSALPGHAGRSPGSGIVLHLLDPRSAAFLSPGALFVGDGYRRAFQRRPAGRRSHPGSQRLRVTGGSTPATAHRQWAFLAIPGSQYRRSDRSDQYQRRSAGGQCDRACPDHIERGVCLGACGRLCGDP